MSFSWDGTAVAARSLARFDLPVCIMASGYHLQIPVHVVTGRAPGPVVLVSCASHGDELWSVEYARRLIGFLVRDGHDFKGTILVAPVLNPLAFESGTRNTPIDMLNLNRLFPGSLPHTNFYSDMQARVIADQLLAKADILFDYHGGDGNLVNHYHHTVDATRSPTHALVHEIALASGAEVVWEQNETKGTLSNQGAALGKTCVTAQYGGGSMLNDGASYESAYRSLLNMLRVVEVVDGSAERGMTRIVVRTGRTVRPAHGGIFLPEFGAEMLGKTIAKDAVMGRVVSPYDLSVIDEILAPYERTEMLQIRDRVSRVQPGDYAFIVGDGGTGYAPGPL